MTAFRSLVADRSAAPPRVIDLPASAWATSWAARSSVAAKVGLRRYSEGDARACAAAAAQKAWRLHPGDGEGEERVEAYNGALMALVVARSTCDADDATIPYWEGADDAVPLALTPDGVTFVYDEIDRLLVEDSPTAPEAGDDDLAWLSAALASGEVWRSLSADETGRARRLLAYAIQGMRG